MYTKSEDTLKLALTFGKMTQPDSGYNSSELLLLCSERLVWWNDSFPWSGSGVGHYVVFFQVKNPENLQARLWEQCKTDINARQHDIDGMQGICAHSGNLGMVQDEANYRDSTGGN